MIKAIPQKVSALLGSVRFWIITLSAIVMGLQAYVQHNGFDISSELDIIKLWLLVVAGVGTLDSAVTKLGSSVGSAISIGSSANK